MARPKKEKPNRADGLYEVKVTVGKTFDGKLIRKSFYSSISKEDAKRQANEYKIEMEVSSRTGDTFITKDITFGEWALKWLQTYKKGNVKEHTYNYTYRVNVEKYIIPFFGNADLKSIKQADIQKYFNKHKYLAETNLKRHKNILFGIFEQAIYNDLCIKNPVVNIKYSSIKPAVEKKAYNLEQVNKILEYTANKDGFYIYFLLNTGLRRGELLGLMWEDVDLEKKVIYVKRAIEPDTVGIPKDGELKTKSSYRTIPISSDCVKLLKSIKKDKVFVLAGRTQWGYTSIYGFDKKYKAYMTKMCEILKLPYLSPHELRHTYGTVLREKGVDLYTISRVLGHSDSGITEKIYVHNDIEVLRKQMKL